MARDKQILEAFENADDAIQGLWGLHAFGYFAIATRNDTEIARCLPNVAFQMTHRWQRFYNRDGLLAVMREHHEPVYCRSLLLILASLFEAVLADFAGRLSSLGHTGKCPSKYKERLEWAFNIAKKVSSPPEDAAIKNRLPVTCGDVDNARRLRNCIAHNRGKYSNKYKSQEIRDGWADVQTDADFSASAPINLTKARFDYFVQSHLELLHALHNQIQREFFQHWEGYKYADENKKIEWEKIFK
jgi:hypothetical protein